MSRYLARLKSLIAENTPTWQTDRTDRGAFVSSVSDQGRHVSRGDGSETFDGAAIEERAAFAAVADSR